MNLSLLIVCIGLGIATYHGVVTILDLFIPDKPKRIDPVRQRAIALSRDAAETKRRMDRTANHYHRLRGIV